MENLHKIGAKEIRLADTIGISSVDSIIALFSSLISDFPLLNFGFHLHSKHKNWHKKIDAAYKGGCRIYDGVLTGLGGCPMSGYELVSNLQMKDLISYFDENNVKLNINRNALNDAYKIATRVLS